MTKRVLKPGHATPFSGQYVQVGPRGAHGKEVTSARGAALPPAPRRGSTYVLADPTRNESGKP